MNASRRVTAMILLTWMTLISGCSVKVGGRERVDIGPYDFRGDRNSDSVQAPPTQTHEEARDKLDDAYREIGRLQNRIRELERENQKLDDEVRLTKTERDRARDEVKQLRKQR